MGTTTISWTYDDDGNPGSTLNTGRGCTRISAGCSNCYIERTAPLRTVGRRFDGPGIGGKIPTSMHPDQLVKPLKARKPQRWFLNSLTDTFHADYPDRFVALTFAMMATARHHTFQVPTKRPARMRALMKSPAFRELVDSEWAALPTTLGRPKLVQATADLPSARWPLDNVWLAVSIENQATADQRIPQLLDTPAVVRWISAEPLLEPVDLRSFLRPDSATGRDGLDWVVVGGESGPKDKVTRMDPDWFDKIHAHCLDAQVPYFFKQTGTLLAREWGLPGAGDKPHLWPQPFPQRFPTPKLERVTTGVLR